MAGQRFGDGVLSGHATQICHILTRMARERRTTTFVELAGLAGINPAFPPAVVPPLNQVAARCEARRTPPLTALVLLAGDGVPVDSPRYSGVLG